jgi:hypothetical protein
MTDFSAARTPTMSGDDKPVTSARDVREAWDRGIKSTRQEREQAAVNGTFMRNKQWVYWNRGSGRLEELPRNPSRVRATVNRIGPDSRRIISKLARRPLIFDVPPTTPDDAAMRAARVAEAALAEVHHKQAWETMRLDHATCAWQDGVAALCVEWDDRVGTPVAVDDMGRTIGTGDVRLSVVSIHEMAFEPGTRDAERARWWVRGQALPPADVQEMFGLASKPREDARAVDTIWRMSDQGDRGEQTPLTMVLTYTERPSGMHPGQIMTVVNDIIVEQTPWTYPFDDRLNLALAVVEPVHGRWYGHTPVSDAVPVQAILNASWSSIVEHMKLCGNARLWVPQGSVDDIENLTDTAGEAMEFNPINGQKPEYESPPTMPDWWIRQPQMLGDALDDILSVHAVSRGDAPAGIESGIALSILAENDDTPVGALARSLGDCWGRAASMVLKLYETNVQESRQATVHLPGNVPEVVQWTGQDMLGQTEAVVPTDSIMPRSRAAQAAYAMQLYDRQIITNPTSLAKVADLPDQDDLLAGIDPDTARAQRENYWLAVGRPRTVDVIDDHNNHMRLHRDFMRSERYEYLDPQIQELVMQHMQAHAIYAAEQAAQQVRAAGFSPLAAAIPAMETSVLPAESLQQTAAMQALAPRPGAPSAPPTEEPQ